MGLFLFGKKVKLYVLVDGILIDLVIVVVGQMGFVVMLECYYIFSLVMGIVSVLILE